VRGGALSSGDGVALEAVWSLFISTESFGRESDGECNQEPGAAWFEERRLVFI